MLHTNCSLVRGFIWILFTQNTQVSRALPVYFTHKLRSCLDTFHTKYTRLRGLNLAYFCTEQGGVKEVKFDFTNIQSEGVCQMNCQQAMVLVTFAKCFSGRMFQGLH